ncbi:hypothetical protein [Ammoniphilus sp. 3BR4]|uniref:hypothetical protein n=1 Tax=Ammoniphilus sp. 3BR4 TaxID=3158265 RepID=UPI00346736EE
MDEIKPLIEKKKNIKEQILNPYISGQQRAKLYLEIKLIDNMIDLISYSKRIN